MSQYINSSLPVVFVNDVDWRNLMAEYSTRSDQDDGAPLYATAVIYCVLAFLSWILCIPPLTWHFSQRNVAAGSLTLWIILINFSNSINPLIWPRDNLLEWSSGAVWCDINVRVQVGATIGLASSCTMIARKLARVMDTRTITVTTSRRSKTKEMWLDALWCWGYPLVFIILYYIIQPVRYMILGIVGCMSSYATSWVTIIVIAIWAPLTMCVATWYAGLLVYRLYRYRRDFRRLVSARNSTKSRFIRLFIICLITILVFTPYSFWIFANFLTTVKDPYSWSRVHGPFSNTIMKIPAFGSVSVAKWGQVATGYVVFLVFGTGSDAYNTYKKMLLAIGLGKIFPTLYIMHETGTSSPSSFVVARTWGSTISGKAKSIFGTKSDSSTTGTWEHSVRHNSVALDTVATSNLCPVSTERPILVMQNDRRDSASTAPAFTSTSRPGRFKRLFRIPTHPFILPLFTRSTISTSTLARSPNKRSISPHVSAHVWAGETPSSSRRASEGAGVHVVKEVTQDRAERGKGEKIEREVDVWD